MIMTGTRKCVWPTRINSGLARSVCILVAFFGSIDFGEPTTFSVSQANAAGDKGAPVLAEVNGTARVIDGDSLVINGTRLRLHGVDAPESNQQCIRGGEAWSCGKVATSALVEIVKGAQLNCVVLDQDRYGRLIVRCAVDAADVGERMVRLGLALAYVQYSNDYVAAEKNARQNRFGIWAGKFVEPWRWRRGQRLSNDDRALSDGCLIKGNISRRGEKIYHLPQGADYSRTKIDVTRGERMFCSSEAAAAAGWRKSKR
jgi:endonuclease YncB( thermonuclease family)